MFFKVRLMDNEPAAGKARLAAGSADEPAGGAAAAMQEAVRL